jgi:hypothetical protein
MSHQNDLDDSQKTAPVADGFRTEIHLQQAVSLCIIYSSRITRRELIAVEQLARAFRGWE